MSKDDVIELSLPVRKPLVNHDEQREAWWRRHRNTYGEMRFAHNRLAMVGLVFVGTFRLIGQGLSDLYSLVGEKFGKDRY